MGNQFRQGDVFLIRVGSVPMGAAKEKSKDPDIILAHGEATGHAHRISAEAVTSYRWQGDRLIEVTRESDLLHEEHEAIKLPPGVYKVVIQREYTPDGFSQILD
jgi:hypothetical protein